MRRSNGVLAVVVGVVAMLIGTNAAAAKDYATIARDIVPSGEYGAVPPPAGADAQARMYDGLTPLFNHVSAAQLNQFFKPDTLGTAVPGPTQTETVPHPGVTIVRDAYDVPHIHGATRDDVTWGSGWAVAEDRGLLLQQARYDSLLAAVDAPGVSALNLIVGLQQFSPSAQTENEVAKQTKALERAGRKGRQVLHDVDVYIQGINAYFQATHQNVAPFTRTDIWALNALKGQFVGQGGGSEPPRAEFLASLKKRMGAKRAWKVFNDLREPDDPESPATLPGRAHMLPMPKSTSGNVSLDPNSLQPAPGQLPSAAAQAQQSAQASNILMVSGKRSTTHHPIMVAGPQIGFNYPGLVQEMDLDGPGIHERGVSAAPFPGYLFIGRSQDSAWTLTSAGLDIIDTYAETLCGHSNIRYLYKGKCRPMQFFDAGSLGGKEVTFYRTVHGPVTGYARVHGRLVALARKRSDYGRDAEDLLFYHDLAHNRVHNIHQFFTAAAETPQTFNSFYMDDRDMGAFTSGLVPIRPRNVDPGLPIDGRGREEWRGFYPASAHPQGMDPRSGVIINWNNRVQHGYQAADDNWSLGAEHRVELLIKAMGHRRRYGPAQIVSAMNEAATQDTREITFEPTLSKLLRTGRAPNKRDAQMLALLDAWRRHGGSRLDRTGNGQITDPGAAIMDVAWPQLAMAWASARLDPAVQFQFATIVPLYDEPWSGPALPTGREQTKGWFMYMYKDLRTILGERVRGRYGVEYCARGNLKRCRKLLWHALDSAGNELAAEQGPDPAAWRSSATREEISFAPVNLFTMRYTNRPSGIQQIVSFAGHSGRGAKHKKHKKH